MNTIRCSSLPLAFTCPGSLRGDMSIDSTSEPADDGTAVHAGLALVVRGMAPDAAHELMLAEHPACNRGEVTPLFWAGVKMWGEIGKWMPGAYSECHYENDGLSGHLDAESTQETEGAVCDWKSGRKDHDYRQQGFGYAFLKLRKQPALKQVTVHFAWLRTQELESYTVTRERAELWYQELQDRVVNWDGKYHEGPHCAFCPRRTSCPAVTAMVRSDVAMFSDGKTFELSTCTGPELCGFFRKVKMLQRMLEAAERNARSEIGHRGDVLDGEGGVIHYVPAEGPREVDTLRAWPSLVKRLTDEELAPCLKVRLGEMEAAVKAKAGKGKGAAAIRELNEELKAAGAVSRETTQRLIDERLK
jgi:hypothetical protein